MFEFLKTDNTYAIEQDGNVDYTEIIEGEAIEDNGITIED